MKHWFWAAVFALSVIFVLSATAHAHGVEGYTFEEVDWDECYDAVKSECDEMYSLHGFAVPDEAAIKDTDHSVVIHRCRRLSEYSGGSFGDFLRAHDDGDDIVYIEPCSGNKRGHLTYSYKDKKAVLHNWESMKSSYPAMIAQKSLFITSASEFFDSGKAYFILYDTPYVCAVVCDGEDIPKYVVYIDDYAAYVPASKKGEAGKVIARFTDLLGESRYAPDKQRVFDFDFYMDVVRANEEKLPDGYVFTPSGLEAGYINKTAKIDGRTYYFDRNGRCRGLYTGWSAVRTPGGEPEKRYYRRGMMITGSWKIASVRCRFDSSGYLIR